MRKSDVKKSLKMIGLATVSGMFMLPAVTSATTFSTMTSSIFTSNSSEACTQCHHSSLSGTARKSAPVGANFNVYTSASLLASTIDGNISSGYMPMDPGNPNDFIDAGDLNGSEMAIAADWLSDGAPFSSATASTSSITGQTKTSVTLRGTVDTNTLNDPGTSNGEWYFQWGPGSSATYANGQVGNTIRNSTSGTTGTYSLNGLACGNSYHYRAVARNGNNTASGSKVNFSTSSCTSPVISQGASTSPPATNEDTATMFILNRSDDDPGTLTWSVFGQGSKGTFSFDTSVFASFVTVRYTPAANQNGSDTAGRIRVTNSTTGLSDTITVNMAITSINDQPSISSSASTSAIEDVLYSYSVVVNDADDSFAAGLSITLSNEPGDMVVNSSTGQITWTPVNGDTTSGLVTVTVMDGGENGTMAVVQQFTVAVTGSNDPPVITPGATTTAIEDVPYSYQMQVTDIDDANNGADIGFTLSNEPTGMVISSTGLITWTPLEGVATSNAVTVTVEDGNEDGSTPTVGNNGQEIFTVAVTAVNDAANIISTAPTTGNESVPYSYSVTASDVDDIGGFGAAANQLQISLSGEPAGMVVDSATGVITWTPPRTGAQLVYSNITVTVEDGLENGAIASQEVYGVTIGIDDIDGDLVAVYSDNCPVNTNAGQADNDNDTVYIANAGFPAIGDVDPSNPTTGGDACDTDDDNDGILDADELLFPGCLDPFNAADATEDCDGDGVDNITEVNDGNADTSPTTDSVGPSINAPADVTIDAQGFLTVVNLGLATGSDGNDGEVTLFKAAVDLSPAELIALDDPNTGCDALSSYETDIKPFRPGAYTVTWASCDSSGNASRDNQAVNIKPLVSVVSGQSVGEGQAVNINVVLNGDAIAYPASVEYTITGTATAVDDYDGTSGTVIFNTPGDVGFISFNTVADAITEGNETAVITLHSPFNMTLSDMSRHTLTITEENIAPQVVLSVTQPAAVLDVNKGSTLYTADGVARIIASANDGNGDTLSFDWSASSANLLAAATIASNQIDFDPNMLTVGDVYNVVVTVNDGNTAVTVNRLLFVKAAEVNTWLIGDDDDGDGTDNLSEGYGDDDGDGIPNYIDDSGTPANAIDNHTANLEARLYIETDPGLSIMLGETAVVAQATGVLIGTQDIIDFGGPGGSAASNAETDYTFISGLLNFEITGLTDDVEVVHIVIPLLSTIQADTVYRKYNSSGWFDFVIDDLNEVSSAAGNAGSCPPPGSNLYVAGLAVGHLCLQLSIQDGGANDADGVRNYVVKDPGGLAFAPEAEAEPATSSDSGRVGSLSIWFVIMLLVTAVAIWRLRVKQIDSAGIKVTSRYRSGEK